MSVVPAVQEFLRRATVPYRVFPHIRTSTAQEEAVVALATSIRLAGENELRWLYPDCERGAMPPLGPLYRQAVYGDETLTAEDSTALELHTAPIDWTGVTGGMS